MKIPLAMTEARTEDEEQLRGEPGWARRAETFAHRLHDVGVRELRLDGAKLLGTMISRSLPRFALVQTRTRLLRVAGFRIGARSAVLGALEVTGPSPLCDLSIGDDACLTGPVYIDLGAPVRIGHRVYLGHHVTLLTIEHKVGPSEQRCGDLVSGPIEIGDGAWLASRVTVLPGVSIGRGAVVAAGSVVTHDVEDDTLVAGVPARVIRDLEGPVPGSSRRQRTSGVAPKGA